MAREQADLQLVHISTDHLPEHERISRWREQFGRQMFLMDFEPVRETSFRATMTMREMPSLVVGHAAFSPLRLLRPEKLVADGNDDIWLIVPSSDCTISQKGKEVSIAAGNGVFVNGAEASCFALHSELELRCVHVRRAEFAALIRNPDDGMLQTIPHENRFLQYLLSYRRFVLEDPALTSPDLAGIAASHLRDLLALVFGAERDRAGLAEGDGLRAARLQAIKRHITDNLCDPALTIGKIASRHGITPRYVQRLFETEGTTFSAFVLDRRLDHAREMLAAPEHMWQSISAIALEVGFGDISYFNRAFRRRFGHTPNETRREFPAVRTRPS